MVCGKIVHNSYICENKARGMVKQNAIKVFEEKSVRTVWDSDQEEWYFCAKYMALLSGEDGDSCLSAIYFCLIAGN